MALMEACLTVLRGRDELLEQEASYRPPILHLVLIPEALRHMRALVAEMTQPRPLADFWPEVPAERRGEPVIVRSAVASTFVAALELCRRGIVMLDQRESFRAIMVSPRSVVAAEIGPVGA
jgi:chromatin segregation and condensation protein Rec8/ScpA/Scc1 (kleisin family)